MERYTVQRGDTLSGISKRLHITLAKLLAVNRSIANPDRIRVGQILNLPVVVRRQIGTPLGPSVSDIFGEGALQFDGLPGNDSRYVQNAIVAVGIPIWGGAFALYRRVENGTGLDPVMLRRADVSLSSDPLRDAFSEIRVLYRTRAYADRALSASRLPNPFTYYFGDDGLVYPTTISDTTASALCASLRKAVEQERKNAQAAEKTSIALLLWYVGARFPVKPSSGGGEMATGVASESALAGFTAAERAVIQETRQILNSPELLQLRHAHAAGKELTLRIGGRLIQYEPNWPWSGLTNFEANGFTMGRECFSSEAELTRTILHELYRLSTSVVRGTAGKGLNNPETAAAFEFADRALAAAFSSAK